MTPCIVGINLNNTNTIISEILYQNIDSTWNLKSNLKIQYKIRNKRYNQSLGTYKVRNEIETKRNETKSTKTKRNETKRNQQKRNVTKRNQRNENEIKRNQRKQNEINENKTK
jgi:hypothetical protein